eukprot:853526-Pelagomonas_calceolata.AAC.1
MDPHSSLIKCLLSSNGTPGLITKGREYEIHFHAFKAGQRVGGYEKIQWARRWQQDQGCKTYIPPARKHNHSPTHLHLAPWQRQACTPPTHPPALGTPAVRSVQHLLFAGRVGLEGNAWPLSKAPKSRHASLPATQTTTEVRH